MVNNSYPVRVKAYMLSWKSFQKTIDLFDKFKKGCEWLYVGVSLGVLDKETMHLIDQMYYDRENVYFSEVYNKKGLTEWEEAMVSQFFSGCKSILVAGAGGGREVYALRRAGYLADGFECHPGLLKHAKDFLEREGVGGKMYWAPRDECPSVEEKYDGIIVGWAVYTHIQGQKKRIAFLRTLKAMAGEDAPVLLSFLHRPERQSRVRRTTSIANFIRRLLLRDPVEPGDYLAPAYVHFFSKEQLEAELQEAGFNLRFYSTHQYGHAVGISSTQLQPE